jgi:primosomal protein N' (replication factor Y) (superfamily II helicase)
LDAWTGSLVSVPFHGRTVKGWILGPAMEPPPGRLLPIRKVRSTVRFFDQGMLELLRWVSERYIAPLSTVIERSHPPRVAGEEQVLRRDAEGIKEGAKAGAPSGSATAPLEPGTTTWVRPLPGEEASACVDAVEACLARGRRAVVLVPASEPLPFTAAAALEAFGDRAANFVGGDLRERYRTWLDVLGDRYDVVVGTRPAVFAPVSDLGLIWVAREVHPGQREDRSPYYHVREVAMARARIHGAACVLASLSPSVESLDLADAGDVRVLRPPRQRERARAPLVETTAPEWEDRSARLGRLLRAARSAALIVSRRGYGVARVCRSCGQPAACAACRGPIVVEGGRPACRVCGAAARCARCGSGSFGVERGGTERVAEWAAGLAPVPVELEREGRAGTLRPRASTPSPIPGPGRVVVGTASTVKDVGPVRLDLVAILDPDRALGRPGVHAGERSLATWMEASAWAGPRSGGGRVLAQTRHPGHPALQALIRWDPEPFLRSEAAARTEAGFPPNHPVFRIEGSGSLPDSLREAGPETLLATAAGTGTVCLVAVHPGRLAGFRERVLRLAAEGVVSRVEAEPQL